MVPFLPVSADAFPRRLWEALLPSLYLEIGACLSLHGSFPSVALVPGL